MKAFYPLAHVAGPVELERLDPDVVGVALSDAPEGGTLAVQMATRVDTEGRSIMLQRCLYCDQVVCVEGEASWPEPVGRLVVGRRDCPRHQTA